MARKLLIFADGTGNAFATQESNVWRLYCAVDRSRPDQIARYIPGVGTSGFRPYAMLDGVTGIGVPSNVRELYRFLCWSWRPGDEIHMFGFSRGAFTIRTLIGLIHHEGLVPAEIDGRRVSRAEMARNTMAAWRSYRAKSHPARHWLPTIGATRLVRDAVLAGWHTALRHRSYAVVQGVIGAQGRVTVPIRYVGLFDTVEAYGVPIDELRAAVDTVVWPISFRNQRLSALVQQARHALSLDDERQTFHPVRFDRSAEATGRIEEVWFAGAHSDVGGGYPDGELAQVPLCWIAEGAVRAGLRLDTEAQESFTDAASAFGPSHDPRRGLAMFYRFAPRPIARDAAAGGEPVVHAAVAARMLGGSDGYAPLTLPATALVQGDAGPEPLSGMAGLAGDATLIAAARDMIWWRRLVYWLLFTVAVLFVALPWIGPLVAEWATGAKSPLGRVAVGLLVQLDDGVGANLGSIQRAAGGLVPDYAVVWVDAVVAHPIVAVGLGLLFAGLYRANTRLHDRARDLSRAAWVAPLSVAPPSAYWLRIARALRGWRGGAVLHRFTTRVVLPVVVALVLLGGALLTVSRTTVTYLQGAGSGGICQASAGIRIPDDNVMLVEAEGKFSAESLCWASGIGVEKGRRYTIWIDEVVPFFDATIMSGVGGFRIESWTHSLGLPIRRWWSAGWFQPILRIGAGGSTEWPLRGIGQLEMPLAGEGGRLVRVTDDPGFPRPLLRDAGGRIAAAQQEAARAAHARQNLQHRLVARFTAAEDGEIFLYLNDAIVALPFLGVDGRFYANNSGRARVRVELLAPPEPRVR